MVGAPSVAPAGAGLHWLVSNSRGSMSPPSALPRRWFALALLLGGALRPANAQTPPDAHDLPPHLGITGVPGPLVVAAPGSRVLAWGLCAGAEAPLAAVVPAGKGRILAFGHGGYLSGRPEGAADLVAWFCARIGGEAGVRTGGGVGDGVALVSSLADRGVRARVLAPDAERWPAVVVADASRFEEEAFSVRLLAHLSEGGGLVTGGLGWGWLQLHPGGRLADGHPGNRLLGSFGLAWADGTLRPPDGRWFPVGEAPPGLLAHEALAIAQGRGGTDEPADEALLRRVDRALVGAVTVLPQGDRRILDPLRRLLEERGPPVPRAGAPLAATRPLERALFLLDLRERLSGAEEGAHPAASDFPGRPPADAPRVEEVVRVDPAVPGWHSTGLYLDAGDALTVSAPEKAPALGLRLRIGCHTDRLEGKSSWSRAPHVTCEVPLSTGRQSIRWPFGGLVYLVVPRARPGADPVRVRIGGAVRAPLYVAGETRAREWRRRRRAPGPWAELASRKIVVTVPSSFVRELDDPGDLMRTWDRVLDLCADLAGRPAERERPERIVADRQLAAGYMHAGYPIFCHLDQAGHLVDARHLREEGNWGFFHELGHNHQRPEWTFGGTGEVTCNLFTLYVLDRLCGKGLEQTRMSRAERKRIIQGYDFASPDFARWKREPFLALVSYAQIVDAFGWEPYRRVFRAYRALPSSERPATDEEKRDRWLVLLSRAVGRDLGPFFEAWGIPVSDRARREVAGLPDWWCEELPEAARLRVLGSDHEEERR